MDLRLVNEAADNGIGAQSPAPRQQEPGSLRATNRATTGSRETWLEGCFAKPLVKVVVHLSTQFENFSLAAKTLVNQLSRWCSARIAAHLKRRSIPMRRRGLDATQVPEAVRLRRTR